jgi:hypothetical protein
VGSRVYHNGRKDGGGGTFLGGGGENVCICRFIGLEISMKISFIQTILTRCVRLIFLKIVMYGTCNVSKLHPTTQCTYACLKANLIPVAPVHGKILECELGLLE